MNFDKRNPFAPWGFEQEVYTKTSGNDQEKTGMITMNDTNQGFTPITVADTMYTQKDMDSKKVSRMTDAQLTEWSNNLETVDSLFNNNEKTVPSPDVVKRVYDNMDLYTPNSENQQDLSNNYDLNYYGIQHADLYGVEAKTSNEETNDDSNSEPSATVTAE